MIICAASVSARFALAENGVLGNYPDEIVEESCDVCGPLHISLDYHA
jgi:hypothetical protein